MSKYPENGGISQDESLALKLIPISPKYSPREIFQSLEIGVDVCNKYLAHNLRKIFYLYGFIFKNIWLSSFHTHQRISAAEVSDKPTLLTFTLI